MPLLEINNLSKKYCSDGVETPALNNVSFAVEQGDFLAIMGPSGSGKSTLVQILGFLDQPSHGQYLFKGKSIFDFNDKEKAEIRNQEMGFIFQSFHLMPRQTVFENVQMPLLYSELPEKQWKTKTEKAISDVDLNHRTNHLAQQLSGGEKQRAAIARALVCQPSIIFADEPTGNLDSKSGSQIMEVIEKLNNQGHTIILITHETYTAQYAQKIIFLKDGQIERIEKIGKQRKDGFFK